MKKCPKCGNSYTDETLSFCLTDGAVLEEVAGAETEEFPSRTTGERGRGRIAIDIPGGEPSLPGSSDRTAPSAADERNGPNIKFIVSIIVALLFLTAVTSAFLVYVVFLTNSGNEPVRRAAVNDSNSEVEELKKRLEELSNRIENDNSGPIGSNTSPEQSPESAPEFDEEVIQRVNSPGDGFLALRDQPSARSGNRVAKIPHGEIVVMERCQEKTETIGGRTGRWCYVRWEGKTGWVFDVWLTD